MKTRVLLFGTTADDINIFVRCFREVAHKYEVTILLEPHNYANVMTNFGRIALSPLNEFSADCLIEYLQKYAHLYDVLMPSGFCSVKLISASIDRLYNFIRVVELPDFALINELDDKLNFAHYCSSHGLPHPATIAGKDFFKDMDSFKKFPVLLKHRLGAGKQGIRLAKTPEDALAGPESDIAEDYIVQEYLLGHDFAFNGFCRNGSIVSWTVQKFHSISILNRDRLRISTFVKNDQIFFWAEKLIAMTKYSGPINIDFRYIPAEESNYFIEVNPRFWSNVHYSLIDGVNFVDIAIDPEIPANRIKPLHAGKTWGEPIKTLILMVCFFQFGLLRYILSQSMLQFKIGVLDRLDRMYSRYVSAGSKAAALL
ncbi:ATP-grasp domain-containing protein [Geobacter pelophilus]|uniref:ATP-grasp domain-containing protein n=1 Tax=Geoanaerobacter pelophilus TaxID=60036 RepID=A0AAW4L4J4_9BACT|nr:ATP-grasp domain-containing protein [Geoanaerobacter pelophilus]MBT0662722.1 ATP-grasp domain-containing protein [Geoanaerobacter pelophilus]